MPKNRPLEFHRTGFECRDKKLLFQIQETFSRYRRYVAGLRLTNPAGTYENLNLSTFTLRLIETGLTAMNLRLMRKGGSE
ncbi:MAG: hypothetical protein ABSG74_01965 [Candidatus Bathyarchaeia archaeon]